MRTVIAALGLALLATGCGSTGDKPAAKPKPTETPMSVHGTLTLSGSATSYDGDGNPGEACYGATGFDDIVSGAQVVVRDSATKTVGLGQLGDGVIRSNNCVFAFDIGDIESKDKIFSVEVSHRGQIQFNRTDAETVALTLGD